MNSVRSGVPGAGGKGGRSRSLSLDTPVMVWGAPTIGPAFNEPLVEGAWTQAQERELGAWGMFTHR
ncbi:MAG: hypothetical protein R2817_00910 [Flavobacteriales bacterium]